MALLRGINVGGKNIVKMADLQACLECAGLNDVCTYIQSGNVLFKSQDRNLARLTHAIEQALCEALVAGAQVVVVSAKQLATVVAEAPPDFGADSTAYRYDVVFLKPPARAGELLSTIKAKQGVDEAVEKNGVLYFRRLTSRASESKFPALIGHPAYKSMTIRNWNTVRKLYELSLDTSP